MRLTMRQAIIEYWPPEAGPKPAIEHFVCIEELQQFLENAMTVLIGTLEQIASNLYMSESDGASERHARFDAMFHAFNIILYESKKDTPMGKLVYSLFEAVVEPNLIQPTTIYDY